MTEAKETAQPWRQRGHSMATEGALNGHRRSTWWPQREHSIATEGARNGHRGSTQWPQREHTLVTEGALNGHRGSTQWLQREHSQRCSVTVGIMSCRPGSKLGLGPTWQDNQVWTGEWGLDQKRGQEARHSGTGLSSQCWAG